MAAEPGIDPAVPPRAGPNRDLTREGIEPNPGPHGPVGGHTVDEYNVVSRAVEPYFDDFVHVMADGLERYAPDIDFVGYVQAGEKLIDKVIPMLSPAPAVHYLFDPVVDMFAQNAPPKPPLVGVELNPGPVTLPRRGTSTQLRKMRAEIRQVQAQTKKQNKPKNNKTKKPNMVGHNTTVTQPVAAAYASGLTNGKPVIIRAGDDSVRIIHRELITVVTGTTNFSATSFSMQPGLASVFRWLSTQCIGWEKYRFNALKATYYTRTGTSVPGSLLLVPDYDAADTPPLSEADASTYHGVADDAPWKTIEVNFDMRRSKELFLRSGPLAANLDVKTYDFANLYVCTADGTAVNWGKVYIEYDITLINSQIISNSTFNTGGVITVGGTANPPGPFGTAPTVKPGAYIASATSTLVTFQNLSVGSTYLWVTVFNGSGLTAVTNTITGFTTTNPVNDLVNASGSQIEDIYTLVATASTGTATVTCTGTTVTGGSAWFSLIAT